MSVNRLNLQIGGNKTQEDYLKESVLREVGLEEATDNLIDDLFEEGKCPEGQYYCFDEEKCKPIPDGHYVRADGELVKEQVVTVELEDLFEEATYEFEEVEPEPPQLTRVERMAESMTAYHKRTQQTLTEVDTPSDSDRITMLEDLYAQMRRGQPGTLVSGIGASLDSGGGAVWLWDLEDVNIGTPMNGTYPTIADGYVLAWNESTGRWIPEQNGAGSAGDFLTLSGGIISSNTAFSAGNSSGNLSVRQSADGANDGKLVVKDYNNTSNTIFFASGAATLYGTFSWKKNNATTTQIFPDGTINAYKAISTPLLSIVSANDTPSTSNIDVRDSAGGRIFHQTNLATTISQQLVVAPQNQILQNDENYNGLIILGKGTTAIDKIFGVRDGNLDRVTEATGYGLDVRKSFRQYRNKDNGGSKNNFRIDGSTSTDDVLQGFQNLFGSNYNNTINKDDSMRYYGVCDNANDIANKGQIQDLIAAGGGGTSFSLQGQCNVTISTASLSQPTTISQVAGYYYINNTTGTANSSWTGIANLDIAANTLIFWSATNSRWVAGAVLDTSTYLPISGGKITGNLEVEGTSKLVSSGASGELHIGNLSGLGNASAPAYNINGGNSANLVMTRCSDNSMTFPQLLIEGKINNGTGAKTDDLISITRSAGTDADVLLYKGDTNVTYNVTNTNNCKVINFGSLQTYAAGLTADNTFTGANTFNTQPVSFQKGLYLIGTDATQDIRVLGVNNKGLNIKCQDGTGAEVIAATIKHSESTFNTTMSISGKTSVNTLVGSSGQSLVVGNATVVGQTSGVPSVYFNGGKSADILIERCSDNGMSTPQLLIQGKVGTDGVKDSDLLTINRVTGNAPDNIRYFGRQTDDNDIATVGFVNDSLGTSTSGYTVINEASNGTAFSDLSGTGWFVKYKKILNGTMLSIVIYAAKGGDKFGAGTRICRIGSSNCPTKDVGIPLTCNLNDSPLSNAFAVLDANTSQLSIMNTDPSNSTSSHWAGSYVFPLI
tara:strand:- start:3359 stop:6367 length:3009 start_codon:yes stop_codon:yes gene_type:complete